ncbi:hypothetical protein [Candidatus Spongiihabitans sp.]|uniref:hypothetical protein n=1 Tax=Candidatus Spongiihabitans sp. TaxID=3101308 RepID=UPI003C7ED9DA
MSQFAFVLSIHHCPIICHCPALITIGRAIQLLNSAALAAIITGSKSAAIARLRRTTYFNWIPACGENDGLRGQW